MGLADEIMGTKPEEKKPEEKKPAPGMVFVNVPQIGEDGQPTGKTIQVERHTGLNYNSDFDKYLEKEGKPRKHPPTLQRGVVYDADGKPIGLGGERAS